MRVLGIDPGLTRCGIGIVDSVGPQKLEMVGVGVIKTDIDASLEFRLLELEKEISLWINKYKPDVIAVERVFSQLNVKTAMATGQAAGVALLLAAKAGIPVVLHTPSEVKAAVTGSGRADKKQVAQMVKRLLKLKEIPKPVDSTDALALAICHHWRGVGNARLATAKKKAIKKAMISSISGTVKSTSISSIVVEVGGVGVLLQVPIRIAAKIQSGEMVSFHTYLIVREDALTLYGFTEILDRDFFELLLSVTGIGPKVAQSILANSDASTIANAVVSSNLKTLESVPGLGKKGAQRLVLELKDKAAAFAGGKTGSNLATSNQVENALQGLGYSGKEAAAMLNQVMKDEKIEGLSAAQILKLALKSSGKQ